MNLPYRLDERRLSGLLLTLGAIIFFVAAGMPLWDSSGKSVYMMPLPDRLAFILSNQTLWAWTCGLFVAGSLVALFGLALLTDLLNHAGERPFARLGLLAFSIGVVLWVVEMAFRMSVTGWDHADVSNPALTDLFVRLSGWMQTLFIVDTALVLLGIVSYGVSLLLVSLLPRWAGWAAFAFGGLGLLVLTVTGDLPPFVTYIPLVVLGVRLLIRPRTAPAKDDTAEARLASRTS